jgi:hypothetical protein
MSMIKEKTNSKTFSKKEDYENIKKEISELRLLNETLELRLKYTNMNLSTKSKECCKIKILLREKDNYLKYMKGDLKKKDITISNLKSLLK